MLPRLLLVFVVIAGVCLWVQTSVAADSEFEEVYETTITSEYMEDVWLNSDPAGQMLNYGEHGGAIAAYYGSSHLLRLIDLEDAIGLHKTIISCSLYVYISNADGNSGDKTVAIKQVLKPWIAGTLNGGDPGNGEGATYLDWSADDFEWGLPGGHLEDDNGDFNKGDGKGADCKETPIDEITVPQTSAYPWVNEGYYGFEIDPDIFNGWYKGLIPNDGIAIKTTGPWGWVHTWQANYAIVSKRPYAVIEYKLALDMKVTLLVSPTILQSSGGTVKFNVDFENLTGCDESFDVWTLIENISQGSLKPLAAKQLSLSPYRNFQTNSSIYIPEAAPSGTYIVTVFLGEWPNKITTSDGFSFEKIAGDGIIQGNGNGDWQCSSDLFEKIETEPSKTSNHILSTVYPNPFNPTTTITFDLPVTSEVSFNVYDIKGRNIEAGFKPARMKAGTNIIDFDGTNLSSGIYLYRLTSGGFSTVGKMVLMK